jgi:hypothetical protein
MKSLEKMELKLLQRLSNHKPTPVSKLRNNSFKNFKIYSPVIFQRFLRRQKEKDYSQMDHSRRKYKT